MSADDPELRAAQSRAASIGLLVSGTSLAVVAIALRAAGGLGLSDSSTSPSDLYEIGRLTASRSMVSLLAAIGLCWIGYRGVTGATPRWITARLLVLCVGILCVSLRQGLWLVAGLSALLAAVCSVWLRTSRA
jgi:hypothetical protein